MTYRDMEDENQFQRDPTENVKNLLNAAVKRLDDLSLAEARRVNELMSLRAEHSKEQSALIREHQKDLNIVSAQAILQLSQQGNGMAERISVLEKGQYESKGLSQVIPSQLLDRISQLEESRYKTEGTKGGMKEMYGWIIGAIMFIIAIASFIVPYLK